MLSGRASQPVTSSPANSCGQNPFTATTVSIAGSMSSTGRTGKMSTIPPSHHDSPSSRTGWMNSGSDTAIRIARATGMPGWVRGPMKSSRLCSTFQTGA